MKKIRLDYHCYGCDAAFDVEVEAEDLEKAFERYGVTAPHAQHPCEGEEGAVLGVGRLQRLREIRK